MKCPKCKGRMIYEAPVFEGDQGSGRCMICGNRIWEPARVVMPGVPPLEKDRPYQTGTSATNLQRARQAKLAGIAERKNALLVQMAELDKEARMAS